MPTRILPHLQISLNAATLHLKRGRSRGLCGRNRAGKSTLTRAIHGGWALPDISFRPTQRKTTAEAVFALEIEVNGRQSR